MNTIEFIKSELESSKARAVGLLQDMQDVPLTAPTSVGGNHSLWVLGHLTVSESFLFDRAVRGGPNRFAEWTELFGAKSTPAADADRYPSMSELFTAWDDVRADALAHLDALSPDDLDQKSHAPEKYGPMFATVGACYGRMINHPHFHAGQVADARRAAGKPPLFL